jgi:hypothetical protein
MITPSFGLTATERVLPRLALDWTTGLPQPGVDVVRSGVATFVGSNGLIQLASPDTQRVDFSTGVSGLLVEESRTNTVVYSEDFANASWVKGSATVSSNVLVAPDGTLTADKLVENTFTAEHLARNPSVSCTAGNYTASVFWNEDSERNLFLRVVHSGDTTSTSSVVFYKDTLSLGAVSGRGISATAKFFSDGWWLISLVFSLSATRNVQHGVQTFTTTSVYLGDGTSGIYVWGAQLEAGAFPTSYIPTEASAVTRNADVATMTGTNFSDWYNASEGSFVTEVIANNYATTGAQIRRFIQLSDGTTNNFVAYGRGATAAIRLGIVSGGVAASLSPAAAYNFGTITVGNSDSFGYGYSATVPSLVLNTVKATNITSGYVVVAGITQMNIGTQITPGATDVLNGIVQRIAYYPLRLTNEQLQAFTK